jgi:invasion protein IalB
MRKFKCVITLGAVVACQVSSYAVTVSPPEIPAETLGESNLKTSTSPGWVSKCVSDSRKGPLLCSVEETIVLANTGQAVATVVVRIQPNVNKVVMTIRAPVGLFLPAGISFQIDDGKSQPAIVQTCDLQGCYAEAEIEPTVLTALQSSKRLLIICQDAAKNKIVLPLPLDGFEGAFQRIH